MPCQEFLNISIRKKTSISLLRWQAEINHRRKLPKVKLMLQDKAWEENVGMLKCFWYTVRKHRLWNPYSFFVTSISMAPTESTERLIFLPWQALCKTASIHNSGVSTLKKYTFFFRSWISISISISFLCKCHVAHANILRYIYSLDIKFASIFLKAPFFFFWTTDCATLC